ncbi:hypothetical protein [Mesobacillus subterraneus]|uniref:YfjL-like N-terminal domain-containing protein n=1 Tax=Mesobacillus subterraneus TaxID=285983 RepID=A0A427TWV5_9BACI|nr:hypothetical protein [Mesobacillus subterraneus]RSD28830.1 hypothetical protein EJA10_04465 [Mesobacillus subterraneus]
MKKAVLFLVIFLTSVNFFFNGNPLSKSYAQELAVEYLEEQFQGQKFILNNEGYYPGEGTYIIGFQSEDKSISGFLDVRKGKVRLDKGVAQ